LPGWTEETHKHQSEQLVSCPTSESRTSHNRMFQKGLYNYESLLNYSEDMYRLLLFHFRSAININLSGYNYEI
jgi:hypothetical protein